MEGPRMLKRLFPPVHDFTYRGNRLALWLLAAVLALKFATAGAAVFNAEAAAGRADGLLLETFSAAGAQAVLALFGLLGVTQMVLCLLGAVILWRYRALVPVFLLALLLEFLARKGVTLFTPLPRTPGSVGVVLNWVVFGLMLLAWALSMRHTHTE
jgi:hypothetical protein